MSAGGIQVRRSNVLPAQALLPVVEGLLCRGVDEARIEAVFRRRVCRLYEPGLQLPLFLARRCWELALAETGDSRIGLHLAGDQPNGALQPLRAALLSAPSLTQGLVQLSQALPSQFGPFRLETRVTALDVELRVLDIGVLSAAPQALDFLCASLAQLLLQVLPQTASGKPALNALTAPVLSLDYESFCHLANHWSGKPAPTPANYERRTASKLLNKVCDYIADELAEGPTIENFCDRHGMLRRTVARQLRAQNWSFRELLDEYRQLCAVDLVTGAPVVQARVAEQLGYRDLSSFARAFSRWYGQSPGAFRTAFSGGY